jgi:hypothetical protein
MSQRNDLAEKIRVTWDGREFAGLVSCSETKYTKGVIEVPEFKRKRRIQDGVVVFSDITMVYSLQRNSPIIAFLQSFFLNNEVHTAMRIRCDAAGVEFGRTMYQDCECIDFTEPETDLANPTYAKITAVFCPWEIIPLGAES